MMDSRATFSKCLQCSPAGTPAHTRAHTFPPSAPPRQRWPPSPAARARVRDELGTAAGPRATTGATRWAGVRRLLAALGCREERGRRGGSRCAGLGARQGRPPRPPRSDARASFPGNRRPGLAPAPSPPPPPPRLP